MIQSLEFGPIRMRTDRMDDHPYAIAGRRMYAIGMMSGAAPRVGAEHLVGEMGGLWAHPVKALDAWRFVIDGAGAHAPTEARFEGAFWRIARAHGRGGLRITEREWVDEDDPLFFIEVEVANTGATPMAFTARFEARLHLMPCWMSPMLDGEDTVTHASRALHASDGLHPEWGVAVLGDGDLEQIVTLEPGATFCLNVTVAGVSVGGLAEAARLAEGGLSERTARRTRKERAYTEVIARAPNLPGVSAELSAAHLCALLNLKLLETENLAGHYVIAGLPEFPNLFGCDLAYSVPGLIAAGRTDLALASLRALGAVAHRQAGRVPHEVLPDGGVFHPGNTQETPQFVIAVHALWQALLAPAPMHETWPAGAQRPAADDVLAEFYPVCRAAMLHSLRASLAGLPTPYPSGNAMVERGDMLPIKLDSVCYTRRALSCLAEMAEACAATWLASVAATDLNEIGAWSAAIDARFDHDWWIEADGFYADSMDVNGARQLERHWTQVVPLETGISGARAARVLDGIARGWLNEHGLPHTQGVEERVWTLPTGLLALVAARHGRRALAERLLMNIAATLQNGQLGLYEELIPRGLCFAQCWSAALFAQIVQEVMRQP